MKGAYNETLNIPTIGKASFLAGRTANVNRGRIGMSATKGEMRKRTNTLNYLEKKKSLRQPGGDQHNTALGMVWRNSFGAGGTRRKEKKMAGKKMLGLHGVGNKNHEPNEAASSGGISNNSLEEAAVQTGEYP